MPSAREIGEFNELGKLHTDAWGYYRWGQAKNHEDWLNAMKVEVIPDPDPPDDPDPPHVCEIPGARLVPGINALSIRTGPGIGYPRVGYVTPVQPDVDILGISRESEVTQWFRIGYKQWSAAQYKGNKYLEELS